MDQNHPRDEYTADRQFPINGTPLEDEYYPEDKAPRQHFPQGYSQRQPHGHIGYHPEGAISHGQPPQDDLGGPVAGFHTEGYPGQNPFVNPTFYAPTQKKKKVWPWIVGGILLLALIACGLSTLVLGAGAKAISDEVSAAKSDVSLVPGSCREGTLGWEAKVKIVNSGTTKRSYWVQVNLMNGQTRLGEAHAIVNDLGPGQTVTEEASGTGDLVKGATCVIGDVN